MRASSMATVGIAEQQNKADHCMKTRISMAGLPHNSAGMTVLQSSRPCVVWCV